MLSIFLLMIPVGFMDHGGILHARLCGFGIRESLSVPVSFSARPSLSDRLISGAVSAGTAMASLLM
jgi:hypothetical protein